ncbi:transposase [Streptomyces sp. NBC_01005]|nr:Tn3 family transposase [Streptomyces sp. NBC_01362]WSW10337.1 transposase [Streptomyces sp. NBC_01005]WTC99844.1 transposase [Streptomyces sp. NBC_01650]
MKARLSNLVATALEVHWEDVLRIIGSIHTGAVRAYDVIRMLSRDGRPTPLSDAIAHYGRISKTLHILRMADEPGYRRQIKAHANLPEGRHALARKILHGRAGQLYQNYQDGMEDLLTELPGREPTNPRRLTHSDGTKRQADQLASEAVPHHRSDVLSSRAVGIHSSSWRPRCKRACETGDPSLPYRLLDRDGIQVAAVLPMPLATLVRELVATRRGKAKIGTPDDGPWLFPGGQPGRPLSEPGRFAATQHRHPAPAGPIYRPVHPRRRDPRPDARRPHPSRRPGAEGIRR